MSGLEVNKILASIILAILVVTVIGHLGDIIIDVEHHEMEETAYKIEIPETTDNSSKNITFFAPLDKHSNPKDPVPEKRSKTLDSFKDIFIHIKAYSH